MAASSTRRITLAQARRTALAAQGLHRPRADVRPDLRQMRSVFQRLGVVQIDSVNVLTRAHHLPFFSRIGDYDRDRLDHWLWRGRHAFEYHAHEAALVPVELHPVMRHRMESFRDRWRLDPPALAFVESVRDEIAQRGPLAATELTEAGSRTGPWWGLSPGKRAVTYLHRVGELAVPNRRTNFETLYDVPERVIPEPHLSAPSAEIREAHRELLVRSARAHGIGTATDLADYFRLKMPASRPVLRDLVAEGVLEEVEVEGWSEPAYLHPEAAMPRKANGRALLSPFDPLVWFRPRLERLFGFHYRIEIYVPEPKRVYGYYVLPFLLDDALVARVDLKADRSAGLLRARGAFAEAGQEARRIAGPLADELQLMARWLGLDGVSVEDRGDLAAPLGLRL